MIEEVLTNVHIEHLEGMDLDNDVFDAKIKSLRQVSEKDAIHLPDLAQ